MMLRLTLLSTFGHKQHTATDSIDLNSYSNYGLGFNIGFEKRKSITEKLDSYYGVDLPVNIEYQSDDDVRFDKTRSTWTISSGLGFIFGLTYKINSNLNFSAEVIPSIKYSHSISTETRSGVETTNTNNLFSYGLSNYGATIILAYRFGKKKQQ